MQKNRKNLRSLDPRIEVGGKKMLDPVKMDFHLVMPSLKFGCYVSYHDGMGLKNLGATATPAPFSCGTLFDHKTRLSSRVTALNLVVQCQTLKAHWSRGCGWSLRNTWVILPNLIAVGTLSNGTSIFTAIRMKKIRSSRPGVVTQNHRVSRVERLPVTSCLLSVVR